ncbi:hypothetical protein QWU01_05835 [Kluyvera cryocrescens]|uniref:Uncharacterized protein n=1 Tax=Kluyvera cryocrescens TaxID=580 RepID=A0AAW9C668_KLUCR|nr:hypothetical protein [Kluyvera cryocrescens]
MIDAFLQPYGEMGKTIAEMCIERAGGEDHNDVIRQRPSPPCFSTH